MRENRYYKLYIQRLIDRFPMVITHEKRIVEDDGFGGEIVTTEKREYKVAMYDHTGRVEVLSDMGKSYARVGITKMLTMMDVDLSEGETFVAGNRKYRVVFVKEYMGICQQVEIEVVNDEDK